MDYQKYLEMFSCVVGGLGIFLYGMKNMSEGMQAVAGERLRRMIGAITNNRLLACGVGTLVTCIIQSSSVTTVMVVGMVNACIMTLMQAIGVILGANIGTTITGWILVIKVSQYGLPLLGLSSFFYLFSKRDGIRFFFMFLMGLGMVFFGLELMTHGFAPIKDMPGFISWFHRFSPDSYLGVWKCVLVGAALTAIVQSSSATLGITMALALTGAIDYRTAAALILGENIGTTITAILASLGASTNARRSAYAHVAFNVIGACWITMIFTPYTNLVSWITMRTQLRNLSAIVVEARNDELIRQHARDYHIPEETLYFYNNKGQKANVNGDILREDIPYVLAKDFEEAVQDHKLADIPLYTGAEAKYMFTGPAIALTHSGFNIINTILFLPFVGFLARFLMWLVPEKKIPEKPRLTYLNIRILDAPAIGIQQSYKELIRMAQMCRKMLKNFRQFLSNAEPNRDLAADIFQKENDLDVIQKEIVEFIGEIMTGSISHELMQVASGQLRMADELESISDYIQGLMKLRLKIRDTGQKFSEGGLADLVRLHEKVDEYLDLIYRGIQEEDNTQEYFSEMQTKGLAITNLMKECRARYLVRVGEGVTNPLMGLIYTDMLTAYRRIKDHAFNIAEVLVGEK
ncbi:MAG: Na/Pi cotransporter family protein [Planctomycetales bacterium]|nr:Na/Pi cotransporter family protein [Planctomycetales bacterium]